MFGNSVGWALDPDTPQNVRKSEVQVQPSIYQLCAIVFYRNRRALLTKCKSESLYIYSNLRCQIYQRWKVRRVHMTCSKIVFKMCCPYFLFAKYFAKYKKRMLKVLAHRWCSNIINETLCNMRRILFPIHFVTEFTCGPWIRTLPLHNSLLNWRARAPSTKEYPRLHMTTAGSSSFSYVYCRSRIRMTLNTVWKNDQRMLRA